MPNLLKLLPKEILEKEDIQFIYNVLNPLLFDKVKETNVDTVIIHRVSTLLDKDIYSNGKFIQEFAMPYNINTAEYSVYMSDGFENIKLEYFGKKELIKELDDLKDFIFFYFGISGYDFLQKITKQYFSISNLYETNKRLYEENYRKYNDERDIKKRKVYKSTYEHFKKLGDEYFLLLTQFRILYAESSKYQEYSINQLVDNYARELTNHLKIKSFDNEMIFAQSKLFTFLNKEIGPFKPIDKHIFSGKTIVETIRFTPENAFELFAIFAMELSIIREKYDTYLRLLIDNGNGHSLQRSEGKRILNKIHQNISMDLQSDNLTYFLNIEENTLDVYFYFLRDYRLEEKTLKVQVDGLEIPKSIPSFDGENGYGYTIFEYFDDTTKYYKLTIHDFLTFSHKTDDFVNYSVSAISVNFDVVQANLTTASKLGGLYFETNKFVDNFVIYGKNEQTGFFEKLNVAYNISTAIIEHEEMYLRSYELSGINISSQHILDNQTEIVLGFYEFDYVYDPQIYVDFFKFAHFDVNFRYNTIRQYALIDDVIDSKKFKLEYFAEILPDYYSADIFKNIKMADGGIYRKLYDEVEYKLVLNPYNELSYPMIGKISFDQYKNKLSENSITIANAIEKIPFRANLRTLKKIQIDAERKLLIFMYRGNQLVVPLNEGLNRGLNYENLYYTQTGRLEYHGVEIVKTDKFIFSVDGIFLRNPINDELDLIEAASVEKINSYGLKNEIFFNFHDMSHMVSIDGASYKIENIFVDTYKNAFKFSKNLLYVESMYGIPRYKAKDGTITDVDFTKIRFDTEKRNGWFIFDDKGILTYHHSATESYTLTLVNAGVALAPRNKNAGMNLFSIFYAGNIVPENSNKMVAGRENIFNSMFIQDEIYNLGRNSDRNADSIKHQLISEQLDINLENAKKYNMENEPYLMFKSSTASFKGLESYLKSNLKAISNDVNMATVYLVQRNRFISEWARMSSVLPVNDFATSALKDLVADLMETKLMNGSYDDLMDIFKDNEYEKFSTDTNNIHAILMQYILRFLDNESLTDNFSYYLTHDVWVPNNRKTIIDFIKENAPDATVRALSTMKFKLEDEKLSLFHAFTQTLSSKNSQIIESYTPLGNYSDWKLYQENNHVKFDKPYQYEIIDIGDFIKMPIDWSQPLYMIRPLTDDGVSVGRSFRFLDTSMVTNSQITYDDAYNEYVEDLKNKLNAPFDYTFETLKILSEISIEKGFDVLSVNSVILKWIVNRFIPTFLTTNVIETIEELKQGIRNELNSAEHPNLIVSFNKIKETVLLGDLGNNIQAIHDTAILTNLVDNKITRMDVTSKPELEFLDKIKKPLEHYFDYLFYVKRHDIITKILAMFTEDVIASSMIDLSMAINIKYSKGDETYTLYEKMIYDIFDDFLPFHSVLDKLIFTIKIMESSSSEAMSKQLDATAKDDYLLDIFQKFSEKVKIHVLDNLETIYWNISIYSSGVNLATTHDTMPYDYDRKVKPAGHDIPYEYESMETYGVDDEWFVVNRDEWRRRTSDVFSPPLYTKFVWNEENSDMESPLTPYITDYYHIRSLIQTYEHIDSYFVDNLSSVDIYQNNVETPFITLDEGHLIDIASIYKIKFFDVEMVEHDEYGVDESSGPSSQISFIGVSEELHQFILHDFYDKLTVSILDAIWTDIRIVYDLLDIPGHDMFSVDFFPHQITDFNCSFIVDADITDSISKIWFKTDIVDMADVSLADEDVKLKTHIDSLINSRLIVVSKEALSITTHLYFNGQFSGDGVPQFNGHDMNMVDEWYHDSAGDARLENMMPVVSIDRISNIRIDFGFVRFLRDDPYEDIINSRFYRKNLPGSDKQISRIRDKFTSDVYSIHRDIIRVSMQDYHEIVFINESIRRVINGMIEYDAFGGDFFAGRVTDDILLREIHHDFRENIIAIDKYSYIFSDIDVLTIHGVKAGQFERDELFTLTFEDKVFAKVLMKENVDRIRTKLDHDHLKIIKVEEENFVEFKYFECRLETRFTDSLNLLYIMYERSSIGLTEDTKIDIRSINLDNTNVNILDNVIYGTMHGFEISGMYVSANDTLREMWSNKIYKDSMVISLTEGIESMEIKFNYDFVERGLQFYDHVGLMGYTEESIERTTHARFNEKISLFTNLYHLESSYANVYDSLMIDLMFNVSEYISVVIRDSLQTYIHMVKNPRLLQTYDDFLHDMPPHMFNGLDEEFDISTELHDRILLDAHTSLYDAASVAVNFEKISVDYGIALPYGETSVGLMDDIKMIVYGFSDGVKISGVETLDIGFNIAESKQQIIVQDKAWYSYKMEVEQSFIMISDRFSVSVDGVNLSEPGCNVIIRDSIVSKYVFVENTPHIQFSDRITFTNVSENKNDLINVNTKDTVFVSSELSLGALNSVLGVVVSDNLINDIRFRFIKENTDDSVTIGFVETLKYGPGRKFKEAFTVDLSSLLRTSMIAQNFTENIGIYTGIDGIDSPSENFNTQDNATVYYYERLKLGPKFLERGNILVSDRVDIKYSWMVNHYGIDDYGHESHPLEFIGGSENLQMSVELKDEITAIIHRRILQDSTNINISDSLTTDQYPSVDLIFREYMRIRHQEYVKTYHKLGVDITSTGEVEHDVGPHGVPNTDSLDAMITAGVKERLNVVKINLAFIDRTKMITGDTGSFLIGLDPIMSSYISNSIDMDGNEVFNYSWFINRFGVDSVPHDYATLEYSGDSVDRIITSSMEDAIEDVFVNLKFIDKIKVVFHEVSTFMIETDTEHAFFITETNNQGIDNTKYSWFVTRFGIDSIPHAYSELEYIDGSIDRTISLGGVDSIDHIVIEFNFYDKLNASFNDVGTFLASFDPNKSFIIMNSETTDGGLTTSYSWFINRFGVDSIPHAYGPLDYSDDSIDRSVTTEICDTLKLKTNTNGILEHCVATLMEQFKYTVNNDILKNRLSATFIEKLEIFDKTYGKSISTPILFDGVIINTNSRFLDRMHVVASTLVSYNSVTDMENSSYITYLDNSTELSWVVNRYGVDTVPHAFGAVDYSEYSVDMVLTTYPYDTLYSNIISDESVDMAQLQMTDSLVTRIFNPALYQIHTSNTSVLFSTESNYTLSGDTLHNANVEFIFKERLNVALASIGSFTFEALAVTYPNITISSDGTNTSYNWFISKFGVDEFPHAFSGMGFTDGSIEASSGVATIDAIDDITCDLLFVETVNTIVSESFLFSAYTDPEHSSFIVENDNGIEYSWFVNRFGVDEIPHSSFEQEYTDNSVDGMISTYSLDTLNAVVISTTGISQVITELTDLLRYDYSMILPKDSMLTVFGDRFVDSIKLDNLDIFSIGFIDTVKSVSNESISDVSAISTSDNLKFSILLDDNREPTIIENSDGSFTSYSWFVKHFGIDEIPHAYYPHMYEEGDMNRIISTQSVDSLELLSVNYEFIENIRVNQIEELDQQYVSTSLHDSIVTDINQDFYDYIQISTKETLNSFVFGFASDEIPFVGLNNEFLQVSYEFNDMVKIHKYINDNSIVSEESYTLETYQLIESIMRYRFYEKLGITITEDILETALFKYNDSFSLAKDTNLRINLYKAQSDGSVTKSMTVIQDKTSSHIELIFRDDISTLISDSIFDIY